MISLRGALLAGVALAGMVSVAFAFGARNEAVTQAVTRHEIRMRGNSFAPRNRDVALGDTVTWVNADIVRHNAVGRELFDTGDLRGGEEYSWVPADTGTFRYQCTIHERMRGTIRVKEDR